MGNLCVNVAITGAAGQIGYALAFRIAAGGMFGPNTDVKLHLLELPDALPALEGVAMELEDCAFPLLKGVVCTADMSVAFKNANWVLMVGAVPRKAGMERSDLLKINGGIFTKQGQALAAHAASDVRALIVGNPCNTNALIAMHNAEGIPNDRFYAMTMLDEKRARAQLAKKAGVDVTAITEMTIWGNHSATQYPDFYHAKINGVSAADVIKDDNWLKNEFIPIVQQRGAAVIKARGASSAASAANAIISNVYQIVHDTPKGESFSVAKCSNGEFGVDEGLIFSYPCRVEKGELKVVENITLNDYSKEKIKLTLDELRSEREAVKALGLID